MPPRSRHRSLKEEPSIDRCLWSPRDERLFASDELPNEFEPGRRHRLEEFRPVENPSWVFRVIPVGNGSLDHHERWHFEDERLPCDEEIPVRGPSQLPQCRGPVLDVA